MEHFSWGGVMTNFWLPNSLCIYLDHDLVFIPISSSLELESDSNKLPELLSLKSEGKPAIDIV